MAPVTMAKVMKNKHSGIDYFLLRQNKQSKNVSPKSVTMREQPCFMVTENDINVWLGHKQETKSQSASRQVL